MGRKSIFEQLAGKMNFLSEMRRIDKLFTVNNPNIRHNNRSVSGNTFSKFITG